MGCADDETPSGPRRATRGSRPSVAGASVADDAPRQRSASRLSGRVVRLAGRAGVLYRLFPGGAVVDELFQLLIGAAEPSPHGPASGSEPRIQAVRPRRLRRAVIASDRVRRLAVRPSCSSTTRTCSRLSISTTGRRGSGPPGATPQSRSPRSLSSCASSCWRPKPDEQLTRVTFWSKADMGAAIDHARHRDGRLGVDRARTTRPPRVRR